MWVWSLATSDSSVQMRWYLLFRVFLLSDCWVANHLQMWWPKTTMNYFFFSWFSRLVDIQFYFTGCVEGPNVFTHMVSKWCWLLPESSARTRAWILHHVGLLESWCLGSVEEQLTRTSPRTRPDVGAPLHNSSWSLIGQSWSHGQAQPQCVWRLTGYKYWKAWFTGILEITVCHAGSVILNVITGG